MGVEPQTTASLRVAGAAVALLVAAGCGGAARTSAPPPGGRSVAVDVDTGPCTPPAAWEGALPAGFPDLGLPAGAVVTTVVEVPAGVVVEGYAPGEVREVLSEFRGLLAAGDFTVQREDDEGREAEVWFTGGDRQGQVLLSGTRCPEDASGFRVVSGFQLPVTPRG